MRPPLLSPLDSFKELSHSSERFIQNNAIVFRDGVGTQSLHWALGVEIP